MTKRPLTRRGGGTGSHTAPKAGTQALIRDRTKTPRQDTWRKTPRGQSRD